MIVHNLAGEERHIALALPERNGRQADDILVNLLSDDHSRAQDNHYPIALEPYGYRWFRVGGLDYLLTRSEV